jgi:molecular chaperone HscB
VRLRHVVLGLTSRRVMMGPTGLDPFTVFGVEHRLDLDMRTLERRFLQLSRECHPDLHRAAGAADCAAVLTRSAEINDSWRTLSDRWERARALIELSSPGAMDRGRTLDPEFLATALELAEEVAFADGPDLASLRQRLNATCDDVFAELARACAEDDFAAAARRLHESRYVRKALADLDARIQGAPA